MQTTTHKRTARTGAAGLAIGLVLLALSGCPNIFTALGGSGSGGGGGGGGGGTPASTKRILLNQSESFFFNVTEYMDCPVTVTNAGGEATGPLTVALSGANPDSFMLDRTAIPSIAVGGTADFLITTNNANVRFVQVYTATVTVSGSGISSVSFELSCKRILNPVTHPNAFIDYLNTLLPNDAATPILIAFDRGNLGETNLGSAGWSVVHDKVIIAGKYLILDLTNCMVGDVSTTITGIGGSPPIAIPLPDAPGANSFNLIWNNQYIKGIILPSVLTSIGDNACNGCEHLTSVTIPAGVTSIGDNAFNGCSGLTSMVIPANVATIGENAFDGCSGLTSVTFAGNSCAIGDNAFPGASDNGGDGLKTAYNAANPKAGTYTRTAGADDWARQP